MTEPYQLPLSDKLGFCNILLAALGGDGANMAGKLLFKIGCTHLGLDGGYDARYGSEKKGTATDVSVRFCKVGTLVRQSGPSAKPDFLIVFHDDLIVPLDLGAGLASKAVCIVNTQRPASEIRQALRMVSGRVVCLDATRIAKESGCRLNMPLVAALCHELKFPREEVMAVIAKQWPRAAEANLKAYSLALAGASVQHFEANGERGVRPASSGRGPIGWRNMLSGGAIDALTHSTINRDNRIAGRGHVPRFDSSACNSCGICLTVCSDPGGLLWKDGKMLGVDEQFCKGCMRCVEVCPQTRKGHALAFP